MSAKIDAPETNKPLVEGMTPDVAPAATDAIVVKVHVPIRERISALLNFE
jgi:hypothetical protein